MFRLLLTTLLACASAAPAFAREGDSDPGFGSQGLVSRAFDLAKPLADFGQQVFVDEQGRYLLVGFVAPGDVGLASFLPSGAPDTSFGANGTGRIVFGAPFSAITAATRDVFGRIVVVGFGRKPGGPASESDGAVCRYTAFAQLDLSLRADGCRRYPIDHIPGGQDLFTAVTTDESGQIYVAGQMQWSAEDADFLVMKLDSASAAPVAGFSGSGDVALGFDIDPTHPGGDVDSATSIVKVGNSLYVGGYATGANGTDLAIAKISALTGAEDDDFCPSTTVCPGSKRLGGYRTIAYDLGGGNNERIRAMVATPQGQIVVAGEVQRSVSGSLSNNYLVTRLAPNGTFATPFGPGNTTMNPIFTDLNLTGLVLRPDGRIVIAGDSAISPFASDPSRVLWAVQLSASGVPDTGFATTFGGGASSIALFAFPNAGGGQPLDHRGGALALDNGRILLSGARLWRQDLANGVQDFDYALLRMQGMP